MGRGPLAELFRDHRRRRETRPRRREALRTNAGCIRHLDESRQSRLPVPLQIVAFRNTKEMRQVAPLFHGKPQDSSGRWRPQLHHARHVADGSRTIFLRLGQQEVRPELSTR